MFARLHHRQTRGLIQDEWRDLEEAQERCSNSARVAWSGAELARVRGCRSVRGHLELVSV